MRINGGDGEVEDESEDGSGAGKDESFVLLLALLGAAAVVHLRRLSSVGGQAGDAKRCGGRGRGGGALWKRKRGCGCGGLVEEEGGLGLES